MPKLPITVLVVEDEPLVRLVLVDFLTDEGYEVLDADGADDAIRILESNPEVQILFTDIDMPGSMDGLRLSTAVRDRWPPIKIVVTSGKRMIEVTDLPDGAVFFSKPYAFADISRQFQDLLSVR